MLSRVKLCGLGKQLQHRRHKLLAQGAALAERVATAESPRAAPCLHQLYWAPGRCVPIPVCWSSSGRPRGREAQHEADGGIGEPGRAIAERQQQQPRVPAHGVAAAGPAGQQRVCHGAGDAGQAGAAQAVQQDSAPGVWGDRAGSPRHAGGTGGTGATRGGTHRTPGSGGRRRPGSPPGAAPRGAGSRSAPPRGPSSPSGSRRVR